MSEPRNPQLDPVKVAGVKVWSEGSNGRRFNEGRQVKATLANGDVVWCSHSGGHRTDAALVGCARKLVTKLNLAAGTR